MRAPTAFLAVLILAAVPGCGDDGDDAAPAGGGGDGVAITMRDIRLEPAEATVKVGQKVTWTNDEDVPHNVVADEGAQFESDTFAKGGTFSHTPEQAGTIGYVCTIHPGMDGTLTVEE